MTDRIEKIIETPDTLDVHTTSITPRSMALAAMSQPYHIVQTACTDKEVKFISSESGLENRV